MTNIRHTTHSAADTEVLGSWLGNQLPARAVITLSGPLGSGKTTFIRGLVAVRSEDPVSSPTFVYHARYQMTDVRDQASENSDPSSDLRLPTSDVIDHVDLYRVHADPELRSRTGIDELLADVPGWLVIEWPLPDLVYPANVPLISIKALGAPSWAFVIKNREPR